MVVFSEEFKWDSVQQSTAGFPQPISPARQKGELERFTKRAGYEVLGVFMETGSGVRVNRTERRNVMALVQDREIDAILVTELSRCGRSTIDLISTLQELESHHVSLVAIMGMTFDLATVLARIAEFERDLISERVRSGLAAARAHGKVLGRQRGERSKADRPSRNGQYTI